MKRIRFLGFISGTLNGGPVVPGAEFDLPDHVAAEFVGTEYGAGGRLAEYIESDEPEPEPEPEPDELEVIETATVAPPQNAAKRTTRPRAKR